jgi:Replication-relaxation
MGTNDVFVAFALAAAKARQLGFKDELSEWRGAAACERRRCKPDGYGLYTRNGVGFGFLLEYDRGTESARKYAAKFRAYYRDRDSGQAARDYNGLPTMLFVTTSASAEDRIAAHAYRAWLTRGTEPLPVQITATHLVASNGAGVLGPYLAQAFRHIQDGSGCPVRRCEDRFMWVGPIARASGEMTCDR